MFKEILEMIHNAKVFGALVCNNNTVIMVQSPLYLHSFFVDFIYKYIYLLRVNVNQNIPEIGCNKTTICN